MMNNITVTIDYAGAYTVSLLMGFGLTTGVLLSVMMFRSAVGVLTAIFNSVETVAASWWRWVRTGRWSAV